MKLLRSFLFVGAALAVFIINTNEGYNYPSNSPRSYDYGMEGRVPETEYPREKASGEVKSIDEPYAGYRSGQQEKRFKTYQRRRGPVANETRDNIYHTQPQEGSETRL